MRCPDHPSGPGSSDRGEAGQAAVLIIGFAVLLAMVVALVVDASAAFLQRQSLDTLADGAALRGADLAATGEDTYLQGVPQDRLRLTSAQAGASVRAYLAGVGAGSAYPGLTSSVRVDPVQRRVVVELRAPLTLPLRIPGSPDEVSIGAQGAAMVRVDR